MNLTPSMKAEFVGFTNQYYRTKYNEPVSMNVILAEMRKLEMDKPTSSLRNSTIAFLYTSKIPYGGE